MHCSPCEEAGPRNSTVYISRVTTESEIHPTHRSARQARARDRLSHSRRILDSNYSSISRFLG